MLWTTFFHSVSLPAERPLWYFDRTSDGKLWTRSGPHDLKSTCSTCTTAPGTSWHRRSKRSSSPSTTTYRSQWDRWGWMISMVRGFAYLGRKKHNKTGFFLQSGGFHAAHGVLQPITISLLAMSPVCNPWAVTVTTTEGLSIASCSTGCSGLFWMTKSFLDDRSYEDLIRFVKIWDFEGSNQWFGTISLTWSGFCIFGLDTVERCSTTIRLFINVY